MAFALVGVDTVHSEKVKPVGRCGVFLFPDSTWQGGKAGAAPDQPRGREAALLSSSGCWVGFQATALSGSLGESTWAWWQMIFLSSLSLSGSILSGVDLGPLSQPPFYE